MPSAIAQARCRVEEETLAELRCVLRTELRRYGLKDMQVPAQLQNCRLEHVAAEGGTCLLGEWRTSCGKIGSVVIHEDGQVFAELNVTQRLPKDPMVLVDAVLAYGRSGALRAELRMKTKMVGAESRRRGKHTVRRLAAVEYAEAAVPDEP